MSASLPRLSLKSSALISTPFPDHKQGAPHGRDPAPRQQQNEDEAKSRSPTATLGGRGLDTNKNKTAAPHSWGLL